MMATLPQARFRSMRPSKLLLLLILIVLLPACSTLFGKHENPNNMTVQQLYARATKAIKVGNFTRAEGIYTRLIARFPYGPYTQRAQINLAFAQYKEDKPDDAYSTVHRYIRTYPAAKDITYAYYLLGLINFNRSGGLLSRLFPVDRTERDQGYAVQSFDDFSQLLQRYPNSRYSQAARQRMIWLRNGLAKSELNTAMYYYQREAYIGALHRAIYIVKHYQRAPQIGDALALMIKCYEQLGDQKLAKQTLQVLKLNYPNHPYFKDPEGWPHFHSMWWRLIPLFG